MTTDWARSATSRLRVAFALLCLHAIVTIPWALGGRDMSGSGLAVLGAWLALAMIAVPIARGGVAGPSYWICLVGALVCARIPALLIAGEASLSGDSEIYELIARSLLAGEGLVFHDPLTETAFRALFPPVYPLLLAGLGSVFDLGAATFWGANVATDLASALLLVRIGARLGSAQVGRAASWLFALWPAFALAGPFAQKEALVTLEVLAITLLLLRLERGRMTGWKDGMLMGLVTSSLMLTQPGLALLPAIFALVLLPSTGLQPLRALLLKAVPAALLLLMPWWIRNFHLFGSFVPLTTTAGLGLWVGNNPQATGAWMPMPDSYRGMPETEMSRRAAHEALEWIWGNPVDFVRLTLFKLFRALGLEHSALARFDLMTPKPGSAVFSVFFPLLQGSLIALLGAAAFLLERVRHLEQGNRLVLLLCGCAIQVLVFSLPFEFGERHRWFLMPFLFLVAAAGMVRVPADDPKPLTSFTPVPAR